MHDVHRTASSATPAGSVALNWATIHAAYKARGAQKFEEIAELAGVSLRTLDRFRDNPTRASLRTALQIRAAAGLSFDDMFVDDTASRAA